MSKAFTKEDGREEPALARPRPAGPRLLTPEGHTRLSAECERLRSVERPKLHAEDSAESRELLRALDARLVDLTALLEAAEVVAPLAEGSPAAFGAWVISEDEAGHRATVRLVGPEEADPRAGLVSIASPLGRALLGRSAGDVVTVERPRGPTELQVVQVRSRG